MIAAVFFDLGGTLFEPLPAQVTLDNLARALEAQGIRGTRVAALKHYLALRADLERSFASEAFFLHRKLVLTAASAFLEGLPSAQRPGVDPDRFARNFYALQRSMVTEQLRPREEAACVLQTLRSWGLYVAIVSNIDEDYLGPLLVRVPDFAASDLVLSSEVCQSCKPHPAIFRTALSRSGFAAAEVLYVGDSLTNDVFGAGRLGMQTAWLACDQDPALVAEVRQALTAKAENPAGQRPRAAEASAIPMLPDLLLDDLAELPQWLKPELRRP